MAEKKKKSWISGAVAEVKGKLHARLGIKDGEKIPEEISPCREEEKRSRAIIWQQAKRKGIT